MIGWNLRHSTSLFLTIRCWVSEYSWTMFTRIHYLNDGVVIISGLWQQWLSAQIVLFLWITCSSIILILLCLLQSLAKKFLLLQSLLLGLASIHMNNQPPSFIIPIRRILAMGWSQSFDGTLENSDIILELMRISLFLIFTSLNFI